MQITFLGSLWDLTIGVAAGLAVLEIQRISERTGKTAKAKKLKRLQSEYNEALDFALHPEYLICTLILRTMGILLYGVYLILMVKISVTPSVSREFLSMIPSPSRAVDFAVDIANAAVTLLFLTATLFVMIKVRSSFLLSARIRLLESYVKNVPDEIRNRGLEEVVLLIAARRPLTPLSEMDIAEFNKRQATSEAQRNTKPEGDTVSVANKSENSPPAPSAPPTS